LCLGLDGGEAGEDEVKPEATAAAITTMNRASQRKTLLDGVESLTGGDEREVAMPDEEVFFDIVRCEKIEASERRGRRRLTQKKGRR
jgi:hypothetical protein